METVKDLSMGYPVGESRLVQQWTWFSLWIEAEASGGSSDLLKDDYVNMGTGSLNELTQIGEAYHDKISNSELTDIFGDWRSTRCGGESYGWND